MKLKISILYNIQACIRITLTLLFAAFLLTPSSATFAKKSNKSTQDQKSQTVLLQGFASETEIYYTILSSAGLIAEGRGETGAEGDFILEYNAPQDSEQAYHVYDFKIAKDGNYLDILVRHNLETGKITTTGNGLEQFSEVSIITPNHISKTKADWAGVFFESDTLKTTEKDNSYEIALHGFSGIGAMGKKQSPAIIKVLTAPNGGLFTNNPVPPSALPGFVASPPSSGIYPLSTTATAVDATVTFIVRNYIRALMLMTEQLSAVVMQQTLAIGQFFDAKIQLEAQRTHQALKAEAVKDYHPSEEMCRIGSYVRSLANTELKAVADKYALNDVMMERYKGQSSGSAMTASQDMNARLKQFRETYCNPKDNNEKLGYMCEHDQDDDLSNSLPPTAAPPDGTGGRPGTSTFSGATVVTTRFNKDVDYTRTMDFPQTLDVDMNDGIYAADEEDILALAKNLYWPTPMTYGTDGKKLKEQAPGYMDSQRVIALKNIAHNSYTNLASLKARAKTPPSGGGLEPGWTFMKTLMRDFGITDSEIEQLIGVQPSYWAQMDVLTKKIYQLPNFYTNLYDKPVNVERISVTLDAIKLMQMRDYYNSYQRREMLNSALLETELINGNHYSSAASDVLFKN